MGGSDDPSNLIELSVTEHAEAHRILYEKHGKLEDKVAWMALSGQITNQEALQQVLSQPKSEETKRKMSAAHKGVPLSEKCKENMRKSWAAGTRTSGRKGQKNSETHTSKIVDKTSKDWIVTMPNGSQIVVKNLKEFCRLNGLNSRNLYKTSNGKRNHHKGFSVKQIIRIS